MAPIGKLGKAAARRDVRTIRLARLLGPDLPPAPAQVNWGGLLGNVGWGMMGNDRLGDCTCAAAGHLIMEWTGNVGPWFRPADADILSAYSAVSGWDPVSGANDNGAVVLDVLNYWRNTGIAGHRIGGYASIDPLNLDMLQQACFIFEGAYIGVQLPISAQNQDVWDAVDGPTGEPGSWGGHAIPIVGYNQDGSFVCVTWGALKTITPAFMRKYCDEAYAVVAEDMLNGSGLSPNGFNAPLMQRMLGELSNTTAPASSRVQVIPVGGLGRSQLDSVIDTCAKQGWHVADVPKWNGWQANLNNFIDPAYPVRIGVAHSFGAIPLLEVREQLSGVVVLDGVSCKTFVRSWDWKNSQIPLLRWQRKNVSWLSSLGFWETPLRLDNCQVAPKICDASHNDLPHVTAVLNDLVSFITGCVAQMEKP